MAIENAGAASEVLIAAMVVGANTARYGLVSLAVRTVANRICKG